MMGRIILPGMSSSCAFKALIAARTRQYEFPDLSFARKVHTHDLKDLLKESGLSWDKELANDSELRKNWNIVKDWDEASRYEAGLLREESEAFYTAIADPAHGVLSCLISKYS